MPELPEVETIARNLRQGTAISPALIGKRAGTSHLFWKRSLASPTEAELQKRLPGQTLQTIDRRGKFLVLHFDRDTLLFHLRMSGQMLSEYKGTSPDVPDLHTRFILDFEDGDRLIFIDTRKFGRLWLTGDEQEVVGDLGPEPLDSTFTVDAFYQRLLLHRTLLKTLLLDQSFLAGLGNIYSDETLNLARLHPCQPANSLSFEEAGILLDAIRSVLQKGIETNGASIDWVYKGGDFQSYFRVYQRTGKPCLNCGTTIVRIRLGQRSTHFCPKCQKM